MDAARSCSLSPTRERSASLDTICAGSNHCFAHVDLPDATGPMSTTTQGDGNASGSSVGAPVTFGHATRRSGAARSLYVVATRDCRSHFGKPRCNGVGNGNPLRDHPGVRSVRSFGHPSNSKGVTSNAQSQIRLLRTPPPRGDPRRRSALRGGHRQFQAEPVQDREQGPLPAPDPDRAARDDRPPRRAGGVRSRHRQRGRRAVHPAGTRR